MKSASNTCYYKSPIVWIQVSNFCVQVLCQDSLESCPSAWSFCTLSRSVWLQILFRCWHTSCSYFCPLSLHWQTQLQPEARHSARHSTPRGCWMWGTVLFPHLCSAISVSWIYTAKRWSLSPPHLGSKFRIRQEANTDTCRITTVNNGFWYWTALSLQW